MNTTPKKLEHWNTTAAASASEPISPAGLDKPDKSHRLRSGLLFESQWLIRLGLWELVCGMMILSEEYGLAWATSWQRHLDNPAWLSRAMAMTFMQLKDADKDLIRPLYDDWLWFDKTFDMKVLVVPEYNALCYLLDKDGKRVSRPDGPVTVLRGLKGQDKQEALKTLDLRCYEFIDWW